MTKQTINQIIGTLVVIALLVIGSGESKTITADSELQGSFNVVTISGSGTADNWLTVDASKATMKQLKVTGSFIHVAGGDVSGGSSHGVYITGKNIIVEGMSVHNGVTENGSVKCSGSGGWGSAIKAAVGAENVIIRNNDVFENCGEGIGVTRGVNVTVENNRVWDNFSVNIYLDNSPDSQAVNNYVYCANPNYYRNGAPASGLLLGLEYYSGWGNQMHDVLVDGNTVEKCKGVRLYKDSQMSSETTKNVTISNNVFIGVPSPFVSVAGAVVVNNISGTSGTPTATPMPGTPTRTPTATRTATPTVLPITRTPTPTAPPVTFWQCTVSPVEFTCKVYP